MIRSHPAALLRAVANNAASCPLLSHQREATTALAFDWLLSDGDKWFLRTMQRLRGPSPGQVTKLFALAARIELERK